jgi:hypothetical protein
VREAGLESGALFAMQTGGNRPVFSRLHCKKKKYAAVWNQKLYIGEYSGISSLKLKNSGI